MLVITNKKEGNESSTSQISHVHKVDPQNKGFIIDESFKRDYDPTNQNYTWVVDSLTIGQEDDCFI